jgi:sulfatase maturation enzyme AslB (radical SAM superfamily)
MTGALLDDKMFERIVRNEVKVSVSIDGGELQTTLSAEKAPTPLQ